MSLHSFNLCVCCIRSKSSNITRIVEIFPLDKPSRNELPYSLGTVERSNDVLQGVVSDNSCGTDPCFNDGNYTITWNDFQLVFYSSLFSYKMKIDFMTFIISLQVHLSARIQR
jgi:hypothetical protein